ncbi:MAG: 2-oxoacid:acceptor oxidoreductase family protein [Thermotogae bacterium]|nr:2-oxoacid:acceptor oxidoreductase family protein [Thermotogota bacterium]
MWRGRAGQGAKSAAQILAEVAMLSGKYSQAFPEYGAERSGAPMRAFNRISDQPIKIHSGIENPDIVVVIDDTLITSMNVVEGLKEDGILIVNTQKSIDEIRKRTGFGGKICIVPATKIALEEIKRGIPNTVMLGALVKVTEVVPLDSIVEQFKEMFSNKLTPEMLEGNLRAIKRGYEEVSCSG